MVRWYRTTVPYKFKVEINYCTDTFILNAINALGAQQSLQLQYDTVSLKVIVSLH